MCSVLDVWYMEGNRARHTTSWMSPGSENLRRAMAARCGCSSAANMMGAVTRPCFMSVRVGLPSVAPRQTISNNAFRMLAQARTERTSSWTNSSHTSSSHKSSSHTRGEITTMVAGYAPHTQRTLLRNGWGRQRNGAKWVGMLAKSCVPL